MKEKYNKQKVIWESKKKHIIIIKRKSLYNKKEDLYIVYREKRDYRRFDSDTFSFYDLKWMAERYEYSLEDAINYANSLPDEFIVKI